jgi:hypothetical protein
MSDKINGVSTETLKEVDKQIKVMKDGSLPWSLKEWEDEQKQLALFKEGEKLGYWQQIQSRFTLEELAHEIVIIVGYHYKDEEAYKYVEKVIKVYQGFLDNGGVIDFTKE